MAAPPTAGDPPQFFFAQLVRFFFDRRVFTPAARRALRRDQPLLARKKIEQMWQVPVGQPDQSLKAFVPKTSPADNRLRQLSEQGINVDTSDRAEGMIDEGMCGEYGGAEPTNKEQALMQLEAMGRLPLSDEAAPALEEEGAEQALEAEAAPATLPSLDPEASAWEAHGWPPSLDPEASAWEANGWPHHSQMDAQQVYAQQTLAQQIYAQQMFAQQVYAQQMFAQLPYGQAVVPAHPPLREQLLMQLSAHRAAELESAREAREKAAKELTKARKKAAKAAKAVMAVAAEEAQMAAEGTASPAAAPAAARRTLGKDKDDEAVPEEAPPMSAALLELLTSSRWKETLPALESFCATQGRPDDLLLEIVRGGGSAGLDLSALKTAAEVRLGAKRTIKTVPLSHYMSLFPDVFEVSDGRVGVRCRRAADEGGSPREGAARAEADARTGGERRTSQERRDRLEHARRVVAGAGGVPLRAAARGQCQASAEAEIAAVRKAAEAEAARAAAAAEAERTAEAERAVAEAEVMREADARAEPRTSPAPAEVAEAAKAPELSPRALQARAPAAAPVASARAIAAGAAPGPRAPAAAPARPSALMDKVRRIRAELSLPDAPLMMVLRDAHLALSLTPAGGVVQQTDRLLRELFGQES